MEKFEYPFEYPSMEDMIIGGIPEGAEVTEFKSPSIEDFEDYEQYLRNREIELEKQAREEFFNRIAPTGTPFVTIIKNIINELYDLSMNKEDRMVKLGG